MNGAEGEGTGLLLAMMEPSPTFEEEFQDWYDVEHFPERSSVDGFLTANRLICVDGWPRYLALYDLSHVSVLSGDDYGKIAGDNYSRWTSRVVPRMWGHYRAEGVQIYPRKALFGDRGRTSRTVLWRFRQVPESVGDQVANGLRRVYEERAETAQVRVFRSRQGDQSDYIGLVELYVPYAPEPGAVKAFGEALRYVDTVNSYTGYTRR